MCRIRSDTHFFSAAALADSESVKVVVCGGRSIPAPCCARSTSTALEDAGAASGGLAKWL